MLHDNCSIANLKLISLHCVVFLWVTPSCCSLGTNVSGECSVSFFSEADTLENLRSYRPILFLHRTLL
jgi:hypothetical protein